MKPTAQGSSTRRILGIQFLRGDADAAIDRISAAGGLLVVPAAPALLELRCNPGYREALLGADVVITDSSLMVRAWNLFEHERLPRVSGLKYLKTLLQRPDVRAAGNTLWVMPRHSSARRNLEYLATRGIFVPPKCVYVAPRYGQAVRDPVLLERLEHLRVRHVIIALGGGVQEPLGLYLKQHLSPMPAIHCIGAAIGFPSGDQGSIPAWADHCGLGFLFRCLQQPSRFVPRYWRALGLLPLLWHYREQLPPLGSGPVLAAPPLATGLEERAGQIVTLV